MKTVYITMAYARGLTVFVMPAVHTVLFYGSPTLCNSLLVYLFRFFAEGPGAQLFMLNMGFFLALKRESNKQNRLRRGIFIFLAGYILNFFRLYLPCYLGLLPPYLVYHYSSNMTSGCWSLLVMGDILQFAGLAYLLVSLLLKSQQRSILLIMTYGVVAFAAPFLWGIHTHIAAIDIVLNLFFSKDTSAFFPVFPWLCYAVAGAYLGLLYRQTDEAWFFRILTRGGLLLLATGVIGMMLSPPEWEPDFYRSSPGHTIASTGFQLLWICFIRLCRLHFPSNTSVAHCLLFCSRNITAIYFIHWILIGWGITLVGFQQMEFYPVLVALLLVSLLTFSLVYLYEQFFSLRKQALI